jgi:hypothetical protein
MLGIGVVVTMNKVLKFRVGGREIFVFYLDDKNVLFVREGLGCFFYQFHYRFGNFVTYSLFLFIFNLSESAIEMRYGLDDNDEIINLVGGDV